ncbi:MAG: flagellar basal body-associated FliL family protein [SAR324 cluster bacterium]|nr:flagellar basal body-associated FliL family protein [SAR324 cluster bacterium]
MTSNDRTGKLFLALVLSFSIFFFSPTLAQSPPEMPANGESTETSPEEEKGFMEMIVGVINDLLEKKEEPETTIIQQGPPVLLDPQYSPMGSFVVNLQGGKYFLKTSITLIFEDPAPKLWLDKRLPLVKDLIITQLGRLSAKKLRSARVRELLRSDLRIKINSLFPNNPPWKDPKPVRRVLFEEFYTQ